MKALSLALLLMAGIAIVLFGCSDNLGPVVGPKGLGAPSDVQAPMQKVSITSFSGTEQPMVPPNPNPKFVGTRMIITGMEGKSYLDLSDPRVRGVANIIYNAVFDAATLEGPASGTFSLKPDLGIGEVWEGTWAGYRTMTGPGEWTTNLKQVAHGKGGAIDGMQVFMTEVFYDAQAKGVYYGDIKGYILAH